MTGCMTAMAELRSLLQRSKMLVLEHASLVIVLVLGAVVWALVFNLAAMDFMADGERPYRAVWNGFGEFRFFGLTIPLNFEGYLDYDYYYMSWADQFLSGVRPYTDGFDETVINGAVYLERIG